MSNSDILQQKVVVPIFEGKGISNVTSKHSECALVLLAKYTDMIEEIMPCDCFLQILWRVLKSRQVLLSHLPGLHTTPFSFAHVENRCLLSSLGYVDVDMLSLLLQAVDIQELNTFEADGVTPLLRRLQEFSCVVLQGGMLSSWFAADSCLVATFQVYLCQGCACRSWLHPFFSLLKLSSLCQSGNLPDTMDHVWGYYWLAENHPSGYVPNTCPSM